MEGVSSSLQNNDELVDYLVSRHFIRSSNVEKVFRALDRVDYMPREYYLEQAYEDLQWRNGPLHLFKPSTYSLVMEELELKPGLSFLNIGSGTGYLSTLAGMILGTAGINHGVEVHPTVLEHALKNIEWFLDSSLVMQGIDFCVPKFYLGNGLCLSQPLTGYDRVFCGGSCPGWYDDYLRRLIKVGGILVMPFDDTIMQVRRVAENKWTSRCVFDVFLAALRVPNAEDASNPVKLDAQTPVQLQMLARAAIRAAMYRRVMRRNPMPAERPRSPAPAASPRCSCLPLEPGDSDEDLSLLEIAWSMLDCNQHGANMRNAIRGLASLVTPPEDGNGQQEPAAEQRPDNHNEDNDPRGHAPPEDGNDQQEPAAEQRPDNPHQDNQDNDPRGHDQYNIRDLAKQFMERLATETDPGGRENTDVSRSGDTDNTAIDTDASRLSADTATSYRMSPVLPAETTPGEATDAIISQDPKSVAPRPDLPGMPSEVEIDPGKMAQTEATTSPSEMVWEDTRRDSLGGSEDETDTPKSKTKRQKLDSGIGENTPSGSSPDKGNNSESDGCLPCDGPTAEPEDTFHGRYLDLRRRRVVDLMEALRELPLPHLLKEYVNFGRSYY